HAVTVAGPIQHIGDQHGVVIGRDLYAVPLQNAQVIFDILPDLEDVAVFQHRLKDGDDFIKRQLLNRLAAAEIQPFRAFVGDGDITGASRRDGQRYAAQV